MRIRWRGLELPTRVMRDEAASTDVYGRFVVEPFERGFGTTVGNSLRRILLSSLEGAAVTHVRIKGAEHEFSSLTGVLEDVTEIILNVKSVVVRSTSDAPKTMKVSVKGKAGEMVEVRAKAIECDASTEVINRDLLLCTLTDAVDFEMEMTVGRGRSYVTAEENKGDSEEQELGLIPLDSVFSPVSRVRYRVEDTRVGQRTNYDRLILEIWTNGTVSPEMSLVEASKILRKHLNPFVQYFELGAAMAAEGDEEETMQASTSADAGKLSMPISALQLSVRSSNCLSSANVQTVGQLVTYDEPGLLRLRSFGKTSLREVKRKLADMGLSLKASDQDGMHDDEDDDDDDAIYPSPGPFGPFTGTSKVSGIAPLDSGSMNVPPTHAPAPHTPPAEPETSPDQGVEATSENNN